MMSEPVKHIRDELKKALKGDMSARAKVTKNPQLMQIANADDLANGFEISYGDNAWKEAHWFAAVLHKTGDIRGIKFLAQNAKDCIASSYSAGLYYRDKDVEKARMFFQLGSGKGHYFSKKELALLDWQRSISGFPLFFIRTISMIIVFAYRTYKNDQDERTLQGLFN